MFKPECLSYCEQKGEMLLACPHCGKKEMRKVFCNDTSLYIYNIHLKKIHTRFFAVCIDCKHAFEVAE